MRHAFVAAPNRPFDAVCTRCIGVFALVVSVSGQWAVLMPVDETKCENGPATGRGAVLMGDTTPKGLQ